MDLGCWVLGYDVDAPRKEENKIYLLMGEYTGQEM